MQYACYNIIVIIKSTYKLKLHLIFGKRAKK